MPDGRATRNNCLCSGRRSLPRVSLRWRKASVVVLRPRALNLRGAPTGCGRSWLIASERTGACKNLQEIPEQASTIGIERRSGGRADPDFSGSAVFCRRRLLPVTPEAAGSSPVDPANYLTVKRLRSSDIDSTAGAIAEGFTTEARLRQEYSGKSDVLRRNGPFSGSGRDEESFVSCHLACHR